MTIKTNKALVEFIENRADANLLREMFRYVVQRMMETETERLCAAARKGLQTLTDNQPARLSQWHAEHESNRTRHHDSYITEPP